MKEPGHRIAATTRLSFYAISVLSVIDNNRCGTPYYLRSATGFIPSDHLSSWSSLSGSSGIVLSSR